MSVKQYCIECMCRFFVRSLQDLVYNVLDRSIEHVVLINY